MTLIFALSLAGCSVGPDYFPEAAPTPTKYKEIKGWKLATPRDWVDCMGAIMTRFGLGCLDFAL